mgnify:CR=1 FL=1
MELRNHSRAFLYTVLICGTTFVGRGASEAEDDNSRGFASFSAAVSNATPTINHALKAGLNPQQLNDFFFGILSNLFGAVDGPLEGRQLPPIAAYSAYWFGWASFWKDTEIWDGEILLPSVVRRQSWGEIKRQRP